MWVMVAAIAITALVVLTLVSVLFFRQGLALPLKQRLAGSAHALFIAAILPYGLAIDAAITGEPDLAFQLPIFACLLLAAASMVYSLWTHRQRPVLYLAHLITLVIAVPVVFFGGIAVTGWT